MKRIAICSILLAAAVATAAAQGPRVGLTAIHAMEQSFDKRIVTTSSESPFDLLGTTRGVYLEGCGAVFTAELDLMVTTNITPFLQKIPKDYVVKVHAKKLQRVPVLKQTMREAMLDMASSLDGVPANENIVLGVSLVYFTKWEDTSGLPSQIIMQAQRQKLLDVQLGRASRSSLDSIIRVEEL
ncbi:MAG: hypothetical protein LAP39_27365 [Acidobacteriia bacterium]|nr:hypothetical protein [Terriglobia bacterium]